MEQLTAMLEGMTTRFMSGKEISDEERLAGHVACMKADEVEVLWSEVKEAVEMQERIKMLEKGQPIFQKQGIAFGKFWISYDKMVGCEFPHGPERDRYWQTNVFAKGLHQWLTEHHPELFTTPSTIN